MGEGIMNYLCVIYACYAARYIDTDQVLCTSISQPPRLTSPDFQKGERPILLHAAPFGRQVGQEEIFGIVRF